MSFFDDLHHRVFGGGEDNSGQVVDQSQQPFLNYLRQQAQNQYQTFGQQQQAAGFANAGALSRAGAGLIGQIGTTGGQALDQFTQPGFAGQQISSLADILNRNLSFNMNELSSQFGMAGTTGSRAGIAGQQAIGDTQLALSAGASQIMGQDLERRQSAAGQQAFLQQQGQMGALGGLGGLFDLSMAGYANAAQPLANYANLIGQPTILGFGNSENKAGFFGSGAGEAVSSGIMSGMMSDRRLKRDIEYVGTEKGHRWYVFRYLWDEARYLGVMAQEALRVAPDAVSVHPSGFLMVDYGRL